MWSFFGRSHLKGQRDQFLLTEIFMEYNICFRNALNKLSDKWMDLFFALW